jgi:hypothetical protein
MSDRRPVFGADAHAAAIKDTSHTPPNVAIGNFAS